MTSGYAERARGVRARRRRPQDGPARSSRAALEAAEEREQRRRAVVGEEVGKASRGTRPSVSEHDGAVADAFGGLAVVRRQHEGGARVAMATQEPEDLLGA